VKQNGQVEIAGILIKRGAGVAAQNKAGGTLLHLASQEGQTEIAGMLIESGADAADLTALANYGSTPLYLALLSREVEVAGMLNEHGADVTVTAQNEESRMGLLRYIWHCFMNIACR
jgi:ankyrin repeat protein